MLRRCRRQLGSQLPGLTGGSSLSHRRLMSALPVKRVLVVWHSRTGLANQMALAMQRGALEVAEQLEIPQADFRVDITTARDATPEDVLAADGYLFCAPENLATVSGEMLEFFHRCYYDMLTVDAQGEGGAGEYTETSRLLGRPVGVAIAAGSDGHGAARQIERICQGWRLRPVAETIVHRNGLPQTKKNILAPKGCPDEVQQRCAELGGLVAATVLL